MELRRLARQPIALVTALLLPVAVASLVSVALGRDPSLTADVAVVNLDGGVAGTAFVDDALGDPRVDDLVDVRRLATRAEASRLVDGGRVDAAIILPAGLTAGLAADGPSSEGPEIDVLRRDGASLGADLAEMVVDLFMVEARATAVALRSTGRPLPDEPRLAVEVAAPSGRALDAATHYGPAIGMFFVLAALGFVVDTYVADRRQGLVERLGATAAPRHAVLAGRSFVALAVGAASLAITATTMQLAFGRSWGPAMSVVALAGAVAFAFAGLAAIVAVVVRTPGQAQAVTVALAFAMALASGSFTPPGASSSRPPLAGALPATIALDAFALVTTERAGVAAIASPLAALVAIGMVAFGASAVLASRGVR